MSTLQVFMKIKFTHISKLLYRMFGGHTWVRSKAFTLDKLRKNRVKTWNAVCLLKCMFFGNGNGRKGGSISISL